MWERLWQIFTVRLNSILKIKSSRVFPTSAQQTYYQWKRKARKSPGEIVLPHGGDAQQGRVEHLTQLTISFSLQKENAANVWYMISSTKN